MSILDLSYELILLITDHLTEPYDVYALFQTHRGLAQFLAPVLSKFSLQERYSTAALCCYVVHGNAEKVHSQLLLLRDPWQLPVTSDDVTTAIAAGANFSFESRFSLQTQRALHWAVINDKPAMISFLISKGADIEFRDPGTGGTAIDHAIAQANSHLVSLLVAKGADVSVWEHKCGSLLHCVIECMRKVPIIARGAVEPKFKEILITLLNNGADINVCDKYGQTALHLAAMCWTGAAEELLRAGANVNARDVNENTPLDLAPLGPPSNPVVELLLRSGANPFLRTADHRTPIFLQNVTTSAEPKQCLLDSRGAPSRGRKRVRKCRVAPKRLSEYDLRVLAFRAPWVMQ